MDNRFALRLGIGVFEFEFFRYRLVICPDCGGATMVFAPACSAYLTLFLCASRFPRLLGQLSVALGNFKALAPKNVLHLFFDHKKIFGRE